MTPLDRARDYIRRGWAPVPIPFRAKRPVIDEWELLRLDEKTAALHWNSAPANIGVILGAASNGLADVDLDCPEAIEFSTRFLPTTASFGRLTSPNSHWLYTAPGAFTKQFKDSKKEVLVEFRGTAPKTGNGQQTVFPGSTHKDTGEAIEWTVGSPTNPIAIDAVELRRIVIRLAAACLLKREAPEYLDAYLSSTDNDALGALPTGTPAPLVEIVKDWLGIKAERIKPKPVQSSVAFSRFDEARDKFNTDHPLGGSKRGQPCPAANCEGKNSFKGDDAKGTCFHSSHPVGCGTRCSTGGTDCFVFDSLDVAAHASGRTPREQLEADGYWQPAKRPEEPPPPTDNDDHRLRAPEPIVTERPVPTVLTVVPPVPPEPGSNDVSDAERAEYASIQRRETEEKSNPESFYNKAPIVDRALAPAAELFRRRFSGEEKPLPLPWPGVSKALGGGLWPGAHVVTGATASGKTALAMQSVIYALLAGHPTLYIGLELDTAQIIARLASVALGETFDARVTAHWSDIYLGRVAPSVVAPALEQLRGLPLHIEEGPPGGWSARSMKGRVEALVRAHPERPGRCPFVVLDFLQLVGPSTPDGRREELRERISAASYAGREVARRTGAVVLMLSSISRAGALELGKMGSTGQLGSGDPADLVGLGKESGDIEFSADTVLSLAREPREKGDASTLVWLALAKIRAGVPSWSLLRFNGSWLIEEPAERAENHATEAKSTKYAKIDKEKEERKDRAFEARIKQVLDALATADGPVSARTLLTRIRGAKESLILALTAAEDRHLAHRVWVGGKLIGWASGPGTGLGPEDAEQAPGRTRTDPDESKIVRVSPLGRDGLPSRESVRPGDQSHRPGEKDDRPTENPSRPDSPALDAPRPKSSRFTDEERKALLATIAEASAVPLPLAPPPEVKAVLDADEGEDEP
jgi:hypothetical protein